MGSEVTRDGDWSVTSRWSPVLMGARSSLLDGFGDDLAWSLFDAAPDGTLVVSASGEIAFANEQAAALFGSSAQAMLGRSVDDFLPDHLRGVHRAHRTRYQARPEARRMGANDLELRALRIDGTAFHAEISLSPLRVGSAVFVLAAVRDISDRVAAEDHLRQVLHTLDASEDGVFVFDAESLQYSYVNDGAVRLVGYSPTELASMTPPHLNPSSSESEYRRLIAPLMDDPEATVRRETILLRRDGVAVPVEKTYKAGPPDRNGNRWIIALARDITARLAAEEAERVNQQALQEAEQTIALAEERGRIARELHDTVIQRLFAAGLGLQSAIATSDDRTRVRLNSAIEEIDATIRELRTSIFTLQMGHAAPRGLRGRLVEVVSHAAQACGFEPRLQFDGPIDALDDTIAEHLIPTLREALSNVARHAHAKEVRVAVSATDEVVLTVTDDGVGITGDMDGGWGLTNLSNRAHELGGIAELTTRPNGGCRFEWRVPLLRQGVRQMDDQPRG